jgi:TolA-binding protein
MKSTKKLYAIIFISLLSIYVISCGVWKDFTTYFNTYYNAKTLFDRAEEQILLEQTDVFTFRHERINTQLNQDLTKVIEKCSKILQFDVESSYFDDALFITGKAFYYQQEYAKAQRKFLELASIDSDHKYHNKLWLAKTYLQLRNFEQGLNLLEQLKKDALQEEDESLFNNAFITKIGFFVYREDYKSAVNECDEFIGSSHDDEISALVLYQLGRIYLLQDDKENALKAFAAVLQHSPTFEIEFESRLEYGILLKELDRLEESESILLKLRDEGKFVAQMDRILNEIGLLFYDQGKNKEAINIFKDVDSTYKIKPTAGFAQLMLGEIYERRFGDYDSSYKYYVKAASSMAEREIKMEAGDRSRSISKYFELRKGINEFDVQIDYVKNPDRFLRDSIDYDIAFKEYMEESRKKAEALSQGLTLQQITDRQLQEQLQQQQQPQQQTQSQKPLKEGEEIPLSQLIAQGKVKKPERPKISIDSLNSLKAKNYYELGSLFFSELDIPDSAYHYFNGVLTNSNDSSFQVKTYFALGTYFETLEQNEKADSFYQIVYDKYPKSTLFQEAGKKLGLIKKEEKQTTTKEEPAEKRYVQAESDYYEKEYRKAISGFQNVYLTYPNSYMAPKAIYYVGLIYEEMKQYDSAAFYYGILSSKEYRGNPLSKLVTAKYDEYKIEQEKKLKEQEEKKKALLMKDSLDQKAKVDSAAIKDSIKQILQPDEIKKDFNDDVPINKERPNNELQKKIIDDKVKPVLPDTTKKKIQY